MSVAISKFGERDKSSMYLVAFVMNKTMDIGRRGQSLSYTKLFWARKAIDRIEGIERTDSLSYSKARWARRAADKIKGQQNGGTETDQKKT